MSQQPLTKYQSLIDACLPYNGERFSGTYITHDVSGYPEGVKKLEEIGRSLGLERYPDKGIWINVMRGKGARMERHSEGYDLGDHTIVLFLNSLDPNDGGRLCVEYQDEVLNYVPIEGDAVMFKSWQFHFVTPLEVDKPRITIAGIFH